MKFDKRVRESAAILLLLILPSSWAAYADAVDGAGALDGSRVLSAGVNSFRMAWRVVASCTVE